MSDKFTWLLNDWQKRITHNQGLHHQASILFNKYHYSIGLPATILTLIAGATLLTESVNPTIKIAVGVIGLISAIFTGVQTFYSFSKRSETHKSVSAQLGQIRRTIDVLLAFPPDTDEKKAAAIKELNENIANVDNVAPPLPQSFTEKLLKFDPDSSELLLR